MRRKQLRRSARGSWILGHWVIFCLGGLSLVAGGSRASADQRHDERQRETRSRISYLEAARRALVDGDIRAAVRALSAARKCWRERKEACGFLRVDYQALVGVVYLEYGQYEKSVEAFREVVRKQPQRHAVWLYLGRALYELKKYGPAARALRRAEEAGESSPVYYVLRARAERKAKRFRAARATLQRFAQRFPARAEPFRELAFLFGELGFFRTAGEMAQRYLNESGGDVLVHLYLADSLLASGAHRSAIRLLEAARLAQPGEPEVVERLAVAHARADHHLAAARLFEEVSRHEPRMAEAAADQYRLAGRFRDSLRLNRRVLDASDRLKQKLAILLERRSWSRALHLRHRLRRKGLLSDRLAYQVAYAAVRAGRYDLAEELLGEVTGRTYRRMAQRLAELVGPCRKEPWLCP